MLSDLAILTSLLTSFSIFVPIYAILRKGMLKHIDNDNPPKYLYSKSRITKIVLLNFLLLFLTIFLLYLLPISVKSRSSLNFYDRFDQIIFGLFIFTSLLTAYGTGMYIISIVKEQFTTKLLKTHPEYKTLFITNLFFHGPVSHVLIFSGGFALFFLTAILEFAYPISIIKSYLLVYGLEGIIFGLIIYGAQVFNSTWKHQLPWMVGIFSSYLFIALLLNINYLLLPYNLFFLLFGLTLCGGLLSKLLVSKLTKDSYKYDHLDR